jgi:hypothetical protein
VSLPVKVMKLVVQLIQVPIPTVNVLTEPLVIVLVAKPVRHEPEILHAP